MARLDFFCKRAKFNCALSVGLAFITVCEYKTDNSAIKHFLFFGSTAGYLHTIPCETVVKGFKYSDSTKVWMVRSVFPRNYILTDFEGSFRRFSRLDNLEFA